MSTYVNPSVNASAFSCPHCNAYAKQSWSNLLLDLEDYEDYLRPAGYEVGLCSHCDRISLWHDGELLHPPVGDGNLPDPNQDLDEDIQDDFLEARNIIQLSPRGAAAILRLCLQKLCVQLGQKGKNINDDISALVKKGLDPKIQQALDVVRVIGNNAVHPGEIDLKDDSRTALNLLNLINIIAEVMISQPKHIQTLYDSLPAGAIQAIEKRDS